MKIIFALLLSVSATASPLHRRHIPSNDVENFNQLGRNVDDAREAEEERRRASERDSEAAGVIAQFLQVEGMRQTGASRNAPGGWYKSVDTYFNAVDRNGQRYLCKVEIALGWSDTRPREHDTACVGVSGVTAEVTCNGNRDRVEWGTRRIDSEGTTDFRAPGETCHPRPLDRSQ